MLTQERLQKIKARVEKATAPPWSFKRHEFNYPGDNGDHIGSIRSGQWWIAAIDDIPDEGQARINADFIACAREDVPALIAEIERLKDELAHRAAIRRRAAGGRK